MAATRVQSSSARVRISSEYFDNARPRLRSMCEKLLANPVIENYRFDIQEG